MSYIHSLYLCSHSNVPLSFPSVEPRVFWSTGTTVIPKSTLGKGKRTQVFTSIVALPTLLDRRYSVFLDITINSLANDVKQKLITKNYKENSIVFLQKLMIRLRSFSTFFKNSFKSMRDVLLCLAVKSSLALLTI